MSVKCLCLQPPVATRACRASGQARPILAGSGSRHGATELVCICAQRHRTPAKLARVASWPAVELARVVCSSGPPPFVHSPCFLPFLPPLLLVHPLRGPRLASGSAVTALAPPRGSMSERRPSPPTLQATLLLHHRKDGHVPPFLPPA
jgi:hypothetical protein